jgi:hypothetical protein
MLRRPEPAITSFRAYLHDAHDLSPRERAEIEGYIGEMQALQVAQAPARVAPAATVAQTSPAPEARPVTGRWWFWTGVAALVAGGVITAIALSGGHKSERPPCPAEAVCPP